MTSVPLHSNGGRLRTLVVDDENLARSGLRLMLANDPDLNVEECAGGRDAVRIIGDGASATAVDIVFLDVRMPAMSGFDVIAEVGPGRMPVVVFTTAHCDYAIQAFEVCALDYLLKPIGEVRLSEALARAKESIRHRRGNALATQLGDLLAHRPMTAPLPLNPDDSSAQASLPLRRVLLKSGAKSYYVDVDDIDWIEADAYYARLWTGPRSHLVRQTLNQLESQLDATQFVRVHRSAIVNVRQVRELERVRLGKYCVRLRDGRQIPLSRDRRRALHAALRAIGGAFIARRSPRSR